MKIYLRDRNEAMVAAWRARGEDIAAIRPGLSIEVGDPAEAGAVALVSPANSFGFMDGGIDLAYLKRFGAALERDVRAEIQARTRFGELLVGQATAVRIPEAAGLTRILIVAPTMRVPLRITDPVDIYLATRAAVRCALDHELSSLAMPGMGTGCGEVPPSIAAQAMMAGIRDSIRGGAPRPKTTEEASRAHWAFSRSQ